MLAEVVQDNLCIGGVLLAVLVTWTYDTLTILLNYGLVSCLKVRSFGSPGG